MKLGSPSGKQGNVLIITMVFCLTVGMVLASALKLISLRYSNSVHSNGWNEAIPIAEAGIEEAMTHLHDDATASANGWTAAAVGGQIVYTKERSFADGSYFNTTIYSATSNSPVIYSQGYVRSPLKASQYVSRMVKVCATNPPNVFTKAIATTGTITMNGHPYVDSYDSRIGPYNLLTNRTASGNIATDSTASPAVNLGGGTVYGTVTTGPGGIISGGTVGDAAWDASQSGIEPGWTNNNMNVSFPSNSPPSGASSFSTLPAATTVGGVTAIYLPTGSYSASSFSSSGTPVIITGNVTFLDTGSFSIAGQGYVQIQPGASLTMYVGGNVDVAGNGVINGSGFAGNFNVLGLAGCTGMKFAGNGLFDGTVYAPQADVTITGNGESYGAVIGKTATLNGNANFHYDKALAMIGGLVATSWIEL
jgi:hypothetical protein